MAVKKWAVWWQKKLNKYFTVKNVPNESNHLGRFYNKTMFFIGYFHTLGNTKFQINPKEKMSMIPCSLDCIHQCEGCCILSGGATVTNTTTECPHFEGRRNSQPKSNNLLDRFAHSANVNELNSIRNISAN